MKNKKMTRRDVLKVSAAAGLTAAAGSLVGAPRSFAAAAGPEVTWTMQTAWDSGSGLNDFARKHVQLIEERSKGRIKINFRTGGEIVQSFETWDATGKGIIDVGHACNCYTGTKSPASQLFCSAPSSASCIGKYLWNIQGGGLEMLREMMTRIYNVMVLPSCPIVSETFLYSRKPISSVEELKKLKVRSAGIRGGVFKQAGCSVVALPGGEIVPSLEKGVIDAAEYSDFWADSAMGFADVAKYIYFTRFPMGGHLYMFVNQDKWNKLPKDLKEVVESASRDASAYNITQEVLNNLPAWKKAKEKGLKVSTLPDKVEAYMDASAKAYYKEQCAKDPVFNKILTSMEGFNKEYAEFEPIAAASVLRVV